MRGCHERHPKALLASHRPAVTSETGTGMCAASVLADQFAKGERVLGAGSMDCSVVAVPRFSALRGPGVKR